ncbi:MAG: hypothetical protein NTX00_03475 [Candidatus Parcubacteria bacterium]|nr:hypothetical protein [Candidatus Parcubacteria bacterium]
MDNFYFSKKLEREKYPPEADPCLPAGTAPLAEKVLKIFCIFMFDIEINFCYNRINPFEDIFYLDQYAP